MYNLLLSPIFTHFAAGSACGKPTFLGLEPWYQYLPISADPVTKVCTVQISNNPTALLGSTSPFLLIGLALIDDLLRVATLVAVGYVIYGGIQYETSNGSPDGTKRAQQTIINALVGLVLAIIASAIVGFIGNQLGTGK